MGISEGLSEGEEVDCSPGTIVWVRRRNGSWWPGRVLGPEELSASHLMSPRSGTPVKLLGREDASIDWYNLEKSKRVKAFRCGEFDDCIERAESSQGIPIKKREKYARREDAIIHALELEKQQLEKKRQELGIPTNCTSEKMDSSVKHRGEKEATDLHKYAHHKSHLNSKMSEPSLEEETMGNQLYAQTDKPMRQPSWEDDHSEAVPRMRGLQDFGLRIAPSKKNYNHVPPNHVGSSKNPLATKMRSLSGPTEESFVKRRDRRRPLVQVLQSSRKLPPHHSFPPNSNVMSRSMHGEREQVGVICRAKRSKCVYLPAESDDCLNQAEFPSDQMQISGPLVEEDTCSESSDESDGDVAEETAVPPLDSPRMLMVGGPSNVGKGTGKRQTMQLDEPLHSNQMSHLLSHEHYADISADMGGSKWQLKGKRNIRNLTKRPLEAVDDRQAIIIAERCNGSTPQVFHDGKGNMTPTASQGNPEQGVYNKGDVPTYVDDEGDLVEKNLRHTQIVGYGNRRYPFMLKSTSGDQGLRNHDITDSDEDSIADLRGYWEESDEAFNSMYVGHLGNGMDSMLVDVDLKVQASYQGERVPLVSLMSRLNGTAIIGHPIPIEKLEDGSSDLLLYTNDSGDELSDHNDVNTGLPPVWRTARRTAMHRPPRPHPSSAMEGEEADPFLPSDYGGKPPYVGHLNHKARLMKRSYSHRHSPLRERKFSNKLLKKVSLSNQKTRRLSSIAIEQRFSRCKPGKRDEGLIKPDEMAPAIACVPVKLVFSRILEGVGRTPLKGERKPS